MKKKLSSARARKLLREAKKTLNARGTLQRNLQRHVFVLTRSSMENYVKYRWPRVRVADVSLVGLLQSSTVSLSLANMKLDTVPASVKRLGNLQTLDLRNNNLAAFPECVRGMPELSRIVLTGNKIETIPEWVEEFDFKNIKIK